MLLPCIFAFVAAPPILARGDLVYLEGLTKAVVEEARVRPGHKVPGAPADTNSTGITLIQPGGRSGYPSYWVRDFAMSLDCGYVTNDEMLGALRLTASVQNGPAPRRLKSGGIIPPFAIPDHVLFDGRAVFYPGTYATDDSQGADPWGPLPPADDHYYFVHVAWRLWKSSRKVAFLSEKIGNRTVLERLERAFDAPPTDAKTGAVNCGTANRCVGFGFDDSVYMTGSMSFASLLRLQAARELADLSAAAGIDGVHGSAWYKAEAKKIASHLVPLFADPANVGGWLRGSTGVSRQADVWATLFALHLGALPRAAADRARRTVADAIRKGTIEYQGAVRHVPTDLDARSDSAWERSVAPLNRYQNGGYWHTPTGWLVECLSKTDRALAREVLGRYVAHLKLRDFRNGGDAPVECLGPNDGGWSQNPCYMTSVTMPLPVLRRL